MIRLPFLAEYNWTQAPNSEARFPESVSGCCDQIRVSVGGLRRLFPSRSRPPLCDRLLDQLQVVWDDYKNHWGSEGHRETIDAIQQVDPAFVSDIEDQRFKLSPVSKNAWTLLQQQANGFIDKLPPVLRLLTQLAELIAKGSWGYRSDGPSPHREFTNVTLLRQIKSKLRAVARKLSPLRQIAYELNNLETIELIERLGDARTTILRTIRQHGVDLESRTTSRTTSRTEDSHVPRLSRQPSLAYESFQFAVLRMERDSLPSKKQERERAVWNWLRLNGEPEYQLPKFENWSRYLRTAEKFNREHPELGSSGYRNRSVTPFEKADIPKRDDNPTRRRRPATTRRRLSTK